MMASWEFSSPFCVGRSRGCEVSISTSEATRTVSKRHVGIVPLTETLSNPVPAMLGKRRWLIYDLETMNGTAVNGMDIPKGGNQELRGGDEIVLASAMRQCVRLLVQFPDEIHSRIIVKALAESAALSPALSHHRLSIDEAASRRSPRLNHIINASSAATGFRHSTVTILGSPALASAECQLLPGTLNGETSIVTPSTSQNHLQKRSRRCLTKSAVLKRSLSKQIQPDVLYCQQRKRLRSSGASEEEAVVIDGGFNTAAQKRARENEEEEKERLMTCPVCMEYFYGSATLPCSHTFCGLCISSWFRTSLSCPECRNVVKTVPVRNRALDELIEKLVGEKETFKSLVRRRAWMQRRLMGPQGYICGSDGDEIESGRITRGGSVEPGSGIIQERIIWTNVFIRWSAKEKLAFSAFITEQFGDARVASCRIVGLTEPAADRANITELFVAAQNLLLDCNGLRLVDDECCHRLKIFLNFG
ncbi:hypothetical protein CCR75_005831 [Bremia lactucae]|uniref:E3 ubiquitin-protein ligase CHFR n=1 Tax=Bremia lactucae TaxID=4779 RepID=A0A976IEM2_BRELC|nr:hypothetical protein CCR75_005831 [Bremia lactucae]